MKLDQLRHTRLLLAELRERFVEREHLLVGSIAGQIAVEQIDALPVAAALEAFFLAGVVYQNAAHGLGGGQKEMAAVVPAHPLTAAPLPRGAVGLRSGA